MPVECASWCWHVGTWCPHSVWAGSHSSQSWGQPTDLLCFIPSDWTMKQQIQPNGFFCHCYCAVHLNHETCWSPEVSSQEEETFHHDNFKSNYITYTVIAYSNRFVQWPKKKKCQILFESEIRSVIRKILKELFVQKHLFCVLLVSVCSAVVDCNSLMCTRWLSKVWVHKQCVWMVFEEGSFEGCWSCLHIHKATKCEYKAASLDDCFIVLLDGE